MKLPLNYFVPFPSLATKIFKSLGCTNEFFEFKKPQTITSDGKHNTKTNPICLVTELIESQKNKSYNF